MKNSRTKKLTTVGMLCAFAYVAVAVGRIPIILFLKYDPKDVVIVIGGLIFGPFISLAMSAIVSVVEMVTISSTGIWGCVMNLLSSCSFACTAAFLYKKHRKRSGAVAALAAGWACQIAGITFFIYKPVVTALRRLHLVETRKE